MKKTFFLLMAISFLFLYVPGFYFPFLQEKEIAFSIFATFLCLFFLLEKRILNNKEVIVYLIILLTFLLNLIFNINKNHFNIDDFHEYYFFTCSAFIFYLYFKSYNNKNKFFSILILHNLLFFHKVLLIFQINNIFLFFPIEGRKVITGTVGGVNPASFLAGVSIFSGFYLLSKVKYKKILKIDILLTILLIGYLGTRSVILGLFCVFLFYIYKNKKYYNLTGLLVLFIGIYAGFRTTLFNESVMQRIYIWLNALSQFLNYPLTGTGFGNFKNAWFHFQGEVINDVFIKWIPPDIYAMQSHNEFLQLLAQGGGIFIIALLFFHFFFKLEKKHSEFKYFLIFTLVFAFFDFPLHMVSTSFVILMFFSFFFHLKLKCKIKHNLRFLCIFCTSLLYLSLIASPFFIIKKNISDYFFSKSLNVSAQSEQLEFLKKSVNFYNNPKSYFELGNIFFKKQEYNRAFDYYAKTLLYSEKSVIWEQIGIIYEKINNYERALFYFKEAYRRNPAALRLKYKIKELYDKIDLDKM
ncbi:MAG: O-antigen ligase family protein [Candidatus Muiribacteriota bacterium]